MTFDNAGVGCNIGLCCRIFVVLLSLPGGLGSNGIIGLDWVAPVFAVDENGETSCACSECSGFEGGVIFDGSSAVGFNCITVTCPPLLIGSIWTISLLFVWE